MAKRRNKKKNANSKTNSTPAAKPNASAQANEPVKGGPMDAGQIKSALFAVDGWRHESGDDVIVRDFTFGDFKAAMAFLNKVADAADAADPHPEIYTVYNAVTLALNTHDAGGVTEKDIDLAKQINAI
ncbi:MAG: 4a-hydroxytetrahydrobiopterin dehydratase [Myxococcales bacterium]|nr:4a-hydroxytetrahydrobiopterin dehydratase [Myxococcales bacterium]